MAKGCVITWGAVCVLVRCKRGDDGMLCSFHLGTDCDFCFFLLLTTNNQTKFRTLETRVHRPQDHPPVTVHPPRGNRQGDPARRVQTTLCQHTSYTGVFPTGSSNNYRSTVQGGLIAIGTGDRRGRQVFTSQRRITHWIFHYPKQAMLQQACLGSIQNTTS